MYRDNETIVIKRNNQYWTGRTWSSDLYEAWKFFDMKDAKRSVVSKLDDVEFSVALLSAGKDTETGYVDLGTDYLKSITTLKKECNFPGQRKPIV